MADGRPKTIQIFLPDGNARSIRIAEITSRTVQAVQIPRQKLQQAETRDEVRRVGVYFLFGDVGDDASKPPAYVGEAENCFERIAGHHRQRGFWTTAVTITSKTRSFSFPILDPLVSSGGDQENEPALLHCRGKGAEATGTYTEDGLVVYSGSQARLDPVPSITESVQRRRENLQEEGVLDVENGALVFQQDHAFNSPSGAAGVVLGRSSNGWRDWVDEDGRTLDEIERQ